MRGRRTGEVPGRDAFDLLALAERKAELGLTTSVIIPAREEGPRVGAVVTAIRRAMDPVGTTGTALIDELVVIDGARSASDPIDGALPAAACTKSGKGLVGQRICVFWAAEATWYSGVIRDYAETTEAHLVVYDDGDQRHEELSDPALQAAAVQA